MSILAIDPGPDFSAYAYLIGDHLASAGRLPNEQFVAEHLHSGPPGVTAVICEMVACYGMPTGAEIFDTCVWIGEYRRICKDQGTEFHAITRQTIKQRLVHRTVGVNDSVIRQRLIDLYGPGKEKAIGTKKAPGPLHGVKGDEWAAIAVGRAWQLDPSNEGAAS